jgi:hypothetical protein
VWLPQPAAGLKSQKPCGLHSLPQILKQTFASKLRFPQNINGMKNVKAKVNNSCTYVKITSDFLYKRLYYLFS